MGSGRRGGRHGVQVVDRAPARPDPQRDAKEWLTGALRAGAALRVGTGRGPVDHLHAVAPVAPA